MSFFKNLVGGIPIVGDVVEGLWSAKEAAKNRNFQRDMSDTAHQREVKDLIAAGLNPMLSVMGRGASTPGGAQAQAPNFSQSAQAVQRWAEEKKLLQLQQDNTMADTEKKLAETQESKSRAINTDENTKRLSIENANLPMKQRGELETMVAQIQNLRQSKATSAADEARRRQDLQQLLDDPILHKYVLSASYGEQAQLDKLIKSGDLGDIAAFLLRLIGR